MMNISEPKTNTKNVKRKKGTDNKSFIYSQNIKKKEPMSLYEEDCKIAGGDITSYSSEEWEPR
jgi:hypothetical protein